MFRLAFIVLALATWSCGFGKKSDGGGSGGAAKDDAPSDRTSLAIQTKSDLPECGDGNASQLAYVLEEEMFYACSGSQWTAISIQGPKGDKGDTGSQGEQGDKGKNGIPGETFDRYTAALEYYKEYRRSIVRVTLLCDSCDDNANGGENRTYTGSGFFCADNTICSNNHVVTCPVADSCQLNQIQFQTIDPAVDSVAPGGSAITPFYFTETDDFDRHPSRDAAKVTVDSMPAGAVVLPMSTTEVADIDDFNFTAILSLSFPLGFQDLYTDLGYVNNSTLDDCATGYCPRDNQEFSTSNDTDHGSSGSPLIDIKTGEVVGVTTAGTEGENANYTWAIDATLFEDF